MHRGFLLTTIMSLAGATAFVAACGSQQGGADVLGGDAATEGGSSGGDGAPGADGAVGTTNGDGSAGDAGPRPADEAGVTADGGINPPDAGPGGTTSSIACGLAACPVPAETCCISQVSTGRSFACVAGTTCPSGAGGDTAALKCTGQANCANGTVCCVTLTGGKATSACAASCTGRDTAQLCDPAAGDAGGCQQAEPCSSRNIGDWNLPHTFGTCGGKGN